MENVKKKIQFKGNLRRICTVIFGCTSNLYLRCLQNNLTLAVQKKRSNEILLWLRMSHYMVSCQANRRSIRTDYAVFNAISVRSKVIFISVIIIAVSLYV